MRAGSEAPDGTAATSTGAAAGSRCDARTNRTPRGTGHSPCSGILASLPSRGIWTRTVRVSAGFSGRFDRTRGGDRTVRHGRSGSCVTPPFDPRVASGPRHRGIDRAAGRVQDAPTLQSCHRCSPRPRSPRPPSARQPSTRKGRGAEPGSRRSAPAPLGTKSHRSEFRCDARASLPLVSNSRVTTPVRADALRVAARHDRSRATSRTPSSRTPGNRPTWPSPSCSPTRSASTSSESA
jgi:hypothetical protein